MHEAKVEFVIIIINIVMDIAEWLAAICAVMHVFVCISNFDNIILEAVMALDRPSLGILLDKTHESYHEDTTDV